MRNSPKGKRETTSALKKIKNLYAFISQVNQNIVRVKDEQTLFKNSCKMALEFGKFQMAWIGKFDEAQKYITLVDQSGVPDEAIPLLTNAQIDVNGPQNKVLHTGTYYICNNMLNEPDLEAWKPFIIKYNVRSCMILPVKLSGQVIGTLNLYSNELNFAQKEEIELLVEVSGDISFALDLFERERQKEFDKNNLDALINTTTDLMWSVGTTFDLITSNKPFDKIVEAMTGKVISKGDNVLDISVSADQLNRHKRYYERAFAGESFAEVEYTALPNEFWSEISYYPIRKGNEVIGTACHSRNITSERKAMQLINKSEAFSNGILNSLNSHIAVIDYSGNIIAVNESWKQFARENGETHLQHTGIGTNYFAVCKSSAKKGSDDAKKVLNGIKEVLSEKIPVFYFEYPCHAPNEQRWFGMRVMKFSDDDKLIVIAHQNITERKLAESNLFQSESRLKDAQAIAHIGNFEVNVNDFSEVWSDEMYKIYCLNKNECSPSKDLFLSFIHTSDLAKVKKEMDECQKTFQSAESNFRFFRKDGEMRYGYSEARFEVDENGRLLRTYGILQDVTERKLAEIERIKIVNDLTRRNNDLEQFAYIVSHNLRAPVVNIIGATNALKDLELDISDKEIFINGIEESVNRLDNVIKDLNHILEVKGRLNESKEAVFFAELVDDIKESIANLIDGNSIEIKYDFSEINELFTLKPYLYSIFYNLISNSIKYRRPDIKTLIEIKSHLVNDRVELVFCDNGMGIDIKKNGEQIFGLYKRFHSHIDGKGMGLFMVKTQVENLGGHIHINSKLNEGTMFVVSF